MESGRFAADEAVAELRRATFFETADEALLHSLAERSFRRRLRDGQILFTEGEPSEHLFVVRSGRVRILARSPQGSDLVLAVRAPGEVIGELWVLDGGPRPAPAEALGDIELLAVPA